MRRGRKEGNQKGVFVALYQIKKPVESAYADYSDSTHFFVRAASYKSVLPLHSGGRHNHLVDIKPNFYAQTRHGDILQGGEVQVNKIPYVANERKFGDVTSGAAGTDASNSIRDTIVEYHQGGHKTITLVMERSFFPAMNSAVNASLYLNQVPHLTVNLLFTDGSIIPVTLDLKNIPVIIVDPFAHVGDKMGIGEDFKVPVTIDPDAGYPSGWELINFFAAGKWTHNDNIQGQNSLAGNVSLNYTPEENEAFSYKSTWQGYAFPAVSINEAEERTYIDDGGNTIGTFQLNPYISRNNLSIPGRGVWAAEFFMADTAPQMVTAATPASNLGIGSETFHGLHENENLATGYIELYRLFNYERYDGLLTSNDNFADPGGTEALVSGTGGSPATHADTSGYHKNTWGRRWGCYNMLSAAVYPTVSQTGFTDPVYTLGTGIENAYGYAQIFPRLEGGELALRQMYQIQSSTDPLQFLPVHGEALFALAGNTQAFMGNFYPGGGAGILSGDLQYIATESHPVTYGFSAFLPQDASTSFGLGAGTYPIFDGKTSFFNQSTEITADAPIIIKARQTLLRAYDRGKVDIPVTHLVGDYAGVCAMNGHGVNGVDNYDYDNEGYNAIKRASLLDDSGNILQYQINGTIYDGINAIQDWGWDITDRQNPSGEYVKSMFAGEAAESLSAFNYGTKKAMRHGFALSGLEMLMNRLWYGNGVAPSAYWGTQTLPPRQSQNLYDGQNSAREIRSINFTFSPNSPGDFPTFNSAGVINTLTSSGIGGGDQDALPPASFGGRDGHIALGGWQDVMFVVTFGNTFNESYYSAGPQSFNWARHSTPFFPSDVTAHLNNRPYAESTNNFQALGSSSALGEELGDNVLYVQDYSLREQTTYQTGRPYVEGLGNIPGYYVPLLAAQANSYVCTDLTMPEGRDEYSSLVSNLSEFMAVGSFSGPEANSFRGNISALNGTASNVYNIGGGAASQCDYTRGNVDGCMEMYSASISVLDVGNPGNQLYSTLENATVRVRFSMIYKNSCESNNNKRDFKTNAGSKVATTLAEVLEIWDTIQYIPGNVGNDAISDFAINIELAAEEDVESAEIVLVEGTSDLYELIIVLQSGPDDNDGSFSEVLPDLPWANRANTFREFPNAKHYVTPSYFDFYVESTNEIIPLNIVGDSGVMSVQLYDTALEQVFPDITFNYLLYLLTVIPNTFGSGLFVSGDEDQFQNLDGINPQPTWKNTINAYDEGYNTYIPYAASKFVISRTFDTLTDDIIRVFDFVTYGRIVATSGCTDPTANNYNPAATVDDGSCLFNLDGCTDATADNYNEAATDDDGTCYTCRSAFESIKTEAKTTNYSFLIGRPGSTATNLKSYTASGGFHWRNNTGSTSNAPQGLSLEAAQAISDWQWWGKNLLQTGIPLSGQNQLGLVAEGNYRLSFVAFPGNLTPLSNQGYSVDQFNVGELTSHKCRIYPFSDALADWLNTNAYNQQGTGQRIIVGTIDDGIPLGGHNPLGGITYFEQLTGAQPVMIFDQASSAQYAEGTYAATFDIGDSTNAESGYYQETALNTGEIYIAVAHLALDANDCPFGIDNWEGGPGFLNSYNLPMYVGFFMIGACGCTDPTSESYPLNYPWQIQNLSAFPLAYENQGTDLTCGAYALGPGDSGQLCYGTDDELATCESFWEWCIISSTQSCIAVSGVDDPLIYQVGNNFYAPTSLTVNLKVEGYWVPQLDQYAYGADTNYAIGVYIDGTLAPEYTQLVSDGLTSADGSVAHQFVIDSAQSTVSFQLSFSNPDFVQSTLGQNCVLDSSVIQIENDVCQLIFGCTDDTALNFDPNATTDDGTCTYYTCEEIFNITAGGFDDVITTVINADSVCETVTLTALGQEITVPVVTTLNNGQLNVKVTIDTANTETVQQDRCNIIVCPDSAIGAVGGPTSQTDLINIVLTNYEALYQDGGSIDLGDAGQIVFSSFQAIDVPDTDLGATILSNRNAANTGDTVPDGYDFFTEQNIQFAPGGYFILIMPEISDFVNNEFYTVQECVNEAIYYLEFLQTVTIGLNEPSEPCVEDCANPPCNEEVYGCTDPNNIEYDPTATIDDGSCAPPNDCDGNSNDPNCFDCSTAEAVARVNKGGVRSIDPLIDVDPCDPTSDGEGCTDPNACNYDPFISLAASNNLLCDYCSCTENPEDCCSGEDCGDDGITDPPPECPDPNNPACDFCCDTTCYDPADCPPPPDPCVFTGDCEDTGVDDGGGDDGPTIIDPVTSFECEPEFTVNGMVWDDVKNMIMRCHGTEGSRALVKIRNGVEYDEEDLIKLDLITYLFLGGGNASPLPCLFNCNYTQVTARKEFSCIDAWAKQGGRRWASTDAYAKNTLVMYPYIQRGKSRIAFFRATRDIEPGAVHPRFKDSGWSLCGSRKLKKTDPLRIADGTEEYLTTMFEYFARTCSSCQVEVPPPAEGDTDTVEERTSDPDNVMPRKSSGGTYTGILGPDGEEIIF